MKDVYRINSPKEITRGGVEGGQTGGGELGIFSYRRRFFFFFLLFVGWEKKKRHSTTSVLGNNHVSSSAALPGESEPRAHTGQVWGPAGAAQTLGALMGPLQCWALCPRSPPSLWRGVTRAPNPSGPCPDCAPGRVPPSPGSCCSSPSCSSRHREGCGNALAKKGEKNQTK